MTNREKKAAKVLMALALASIFSGGGERTGAV